nr:cytochrome c class I [Aureimonas sp. AU22]
MDGEDVYRARLAACLAAAEIATLPQVRKRHLAAARQWQTLLDNALELKGAIPPPGPTA